MTKPQTIRRPARVAAPDILEALVVEHLDDAPHTVLQLANLTGYSIGAVQRRLNMLAEKKLASRQRMPMVNGLTFIWHAGVTPQAPAMPAAVPRQATVRTYPPISRRDPLVAALFGPAGARP